MGAGVGTSLLGILPLLAAGFVFNSIFLITQFRLSRADGQRLFFSCAITGLIIGTIAFLVCHLIRSALPSTSWPRAALDWMHSSIPLPFAMSFAATFIIAILFGHVANLFLFAYKILRAKDKTPVKLWAYWQCMQEHISALDELLRRAIYDDSLVLLCLKSRKIYCGIVSETRNNNGSALAYVQLIPFFSISRDKDTLEFLEHTKVEYRAYSLKRAYDWKNTVEAKLESMRNMLDSARSVTDFNRQNVHLIDSLEKLIASNKDILKDISATLAPYVTSDDLDIKSWTKLIPISEIESASLYKDADYGKWFIYTGQSPTDSYKVPDAFLNRKPAANHVAPNQAS